MIEASWWELLNKEVEEGDTSTVNTYRCLPHTPLTKYIPRPFLL